MAVNNARLCSFIKIGIDDIDTANDVLWCKTCGRVERGNSLHPTATQFSKEDGCVPDEGVMEYYGS